MPLELSAISSGLPQVFDAVGKAPVSSAALVSPMTQVPQYATSNTVQPISEGFRCLCFKHPIQVHHQACCRCNRKLLL